MDFGSIVDMTAFRAALHRPLGAVAQPSVVVNFGSWPRSWSAGESTTTNQGHHLDDIALMQFVVVVGSTGNDLAIHFDGTNRGRHFTDLEQLADGAWLLGRERFSIECDGDHDGRILAVSTTARSAAVVVNRAIPAAFDRPKPHWGHEETGSILARLLHLFMTHGAVLPQPAAGDVHGPRKETSMSTLTRRSNRINHPFAELMNFIQGDDSFFSNGLGTIDEGTLPVDVSETDDEIIVRASLPGFGKEDIHIELHDGIMSIKAEHTEESEEKTERFYRRERRVGAVSRRIAMPGLTNGAETNAELRDGVLTVRVPHAEERKPRRISVN